MARTFSSMCVYRAQWATQFASALRRRGTTVQALSALALIKHFKEQGKQGNNFPRRRLRSKASKCVLVHICICERFK